MEPQQSPDERHVAVVRRLDATLTDPQRERFVAWGRELLAIRDADGPAKWKAVQAVQATRRAKVIVPTLNAIVANGKDVLWDDRSWSARLALGAAAGVVVTSGGQGAGIAALGTAIGVPLWVVFGAGGAFVGMLVDELQDSLQGQSSKTTAPPAAPPPTLHDEDAR